MSIDPRAASLRDRLRGRLAAAAATPMDAAGRVEPAVLDAYLRGLLADGADALAVLAHTGRGGHLPAGVREEVIRRAVALGVPVVVGVGGGAEEDDEVLVRQAAQAASLGADGVMVYPPAPGTDPLPRHDRIWRGSGLPLIAFDLYIRPYPQAALAALLDHPAVAALKVARLHDAIACQTGLALARSARRLAITGEDRMFGPSLMWGAEAALVGLAAAATPVTAAVMRAFGEGRHGDFLAASARLDALAAATFTEPFDGYVRRMLWIAAAEGRLPAETACDLFGPDLPPGQRERVLACCAGLGVPTGHATTVAEA
ncbi:dihydrodipicolinate synthase family protein [Phytohabitans kaempferiae]|uniref:Dihydrodipicolinate synthase family protein n=1 Tax=Phytohabitans kaempferiae TaxID=1620943 RepID=A0ABV6MCK0_9ACTN